MADNTPRRLNLFDLGCVMIILLTAMGFGLARAGHAGVNKEIVGTPQVSFDVFITGLKTKDQEIFKVGEESTISIRNVPVTPAMKISKVTHVPKQIAFLAPDGKKAVAFADPSNPIAHDYTVTIDADAEQSKDGYVIRGQKIKIGNQVELEGFKYRVQGVVVDIYPSTK